jgi:hypothetical protein
MKPGNYTTTNSSACRKRVNTDVNFNSPCLNCMERQLGCHSSCEKYKKARENYEERKKVIEIGRKKYSRFSYY